MIRLAIVAEGRTEEEFVKRVLTESLRARDVEPYPILINQHGGSVTIHGLASNMVRLFRSFDAVTSLVDFYGFRGKGDATLDELERRIIEEIENRMPSVEDRRKIFPYVQQYEFEGLLFSDVSAFADLVHTPHGSVEMLKEIRSRFQTPEDINDSSDTAPSKRIVHFIPRYQKPVDGPVVAMKTGLDLIRAECPRFDDWVTRLESLGNSPVLE